MTETAFTMDHLYPEIIYFIMFVVMKVIQFHFQIKNKSLYKRIKYNKHIPL